MRITLQNDEIEEALKTYVSSVGINLDGKNVNLNIIAGRGTNGTSVEIDISSEPTRAKKTVSTVSSSKTKPKSAALTVADLSPLVVTTPIPVEEKLEKEVAEVPANSKSLFA
jgi:hypothetical protein